MFKKPCKRCGKMFNANTRGNRICEDCFKKSRTLLKLRRMRKTLGKIISDYIKETNKLWYKNVLKCAGYVDTSIKLLEKEYGK